MSVMGVLRWVPVCLLVTLGATACGSGSETGGTASGGHSTTSSAPTGSAPPGTPDCATLWHDGGELPRGYQGCADENGDLVKPDRLRCESGQQLIRFDDRYYGVAGGTVHGASPSLEKDREYRKTVLRCRA